MNWLKTVIIDIIATFLIISILFVENTGVRYIILVYTPLMLVLKIIAYKQELKPIVRRKTTVSAPQLFHHIVYCINVTALLLANWWLTAAQWFFIWLISWYSVRSKSK